MCIFIVLVVISCLLWFTSTKLKAALCWKQANIACYKPTFPDQTLPSSGKDEKVLVSLSPIAKILKLLTWWYEALHGPMFFK